MKIRVNEIYNLEATFCIRERSLSIEQRGAEDFVWGHEKKLAQCVGL